MVGALCWGLLGVSATIILLTLFLARCRRVQHRGATRRAEYQQHWRPLLLAATFPQSDDADGGGSAGGADGEPCAVGADHGALAVLVPACGRFEREVLEELVTVLLRKLRGEDHSRLVRVIAAADMLDAARAQLSSTHARRRRRGIAMLGAARHQPALGWLIECCADTDPVVRAVAVDALSRLGLPEAIPPLLELLHSNGVPAVVVGSALNRLAAVSADQLLDALNDPRPSVRQWCLHALGAAADSRTTSGVTAHLHTEVDPVVRQNGLRALGRMPTISAQQTLLAELSLGSKDCRRVAAEVLSELGAPDAVDILGSEAQRQPELARPLTEALARSGPTGVLALTQLAGPDPSPAGHHAAVSAAARLALARLIDLDEGSTSSSPIGATR
ncbi:MAG: HEAT repeat domain-containing protein [Acidimicrobiales bacterium]